MLKDDIKVFCDLIEKQIELRGYGDKLFLSCYGDIVYRFIVDCVSKYDNCTYDDVYNTYGEMQSDKIIDLNESYNCYVDTIESCTDILFDKLKEALDD